MNNFFSIDNALYRFLERISNFLFLNLLWIIMCIPIVTIFPATVAMFAVTRQWVQKKEISIFKGYFSYFKEFFLKSFALAPLWSFSVILFYFNFKIALQMSGVSKMIIISAFLFIGLLFTMTSIFLFPVMVHYPVRLIPLVKNSFLFSMILIWVTFSCILVLLLTILVAYTIPISSIIIWSTTAYIIYFLCHKSFIKFESKLMKHSE